MQPCNFERLCGDDNTWVAAAVPLSWILLLQIMFLSVIIMMEQCMCQGVNIQEKSNNMVGEKQPLRIAACLVYKQ